MISEILIHISLKVHLRSGSFVAVYANIENNHYLISLSIHTCENLVPVALRTRTIGETAVVVSVATAVCIYI
jgi:hypothetical protein